MEQPDGSHDTTCVTIHFPLEYLIIMLTIYLIWTFASAGGG